MWGGKLQAISVLYSLYIYIHFFLLFLNGDDKNKFYFGIYYFSSSSQLYFIIMHLFYILIFFKQQNGLFEVTKADDSSGGPNSNVGPGSGMSPLQTSPRTQISSLKVTVPADLEGSSYIFVCIRKGI